MLKVAGYGFPETGVAARVVVSALVFLRVSFHWDSCRILNISKKHEQGGNKMEQGGQSLQDMPPIVQTTKPLQNPTKPSISTQE